ncbi:adenylate kinase [bacterium]|nr:adenylate kinase [bacterium]
MKKELIFLGPPACGKGTQTSKLAEYMNFPHVDTGSLLRAAVKNKTPEGIEAESYMSKGKLVPVEVVAAIIKRRLSESDCSNGYVLDGFPRSLEQAQMLEQINKETDTEKAEFRAIYFDIDTELLIERIVNRKSCPKCGEIYNMKFKAPKDGVHCDKCKAELTQRKDDTEEIARARFETYYNETAPLTKYYEDKGVLRNIDANGTIEEVWERLLKAVND